MCSSFCAGQKEKILTLEAALPVSRNLCASVGMKIEAENGLSCSVDCLSIILVIQEDYRNVCGFVVVWFGLVLGVYCCFIV